MKTKGIFTWPRMERVTDRYGAIAITDKAYEDRMTGPAAEFKGAAVQSDLPLLVGKRCRIVATVLETRDSNHIGDIFRGIGPSRPNVGEVIDLGEGEFFIEPDQDWAVGGVTFGLKPDDGRPNDWFDPRKLYRLHDQTVALEITPVPAN
jgi:hypothetical protein